MYVKTSDAAKELGVNSTFLFIRVGTWFSKPHVVSARKVYWDRREVDRAKKLVALEKKFKAEKEALLAAL